MAKKIGVVVYTVALHNADLGFSHRFKLGPVNRIWSKRAQTDRSRLNRSKFETVREPEVCIVQRNDEITQCLMCLPPVTP
jgi:hypothetical protein